MSSTPAERMQGSKVQVAHSELPELKAAKKSESVLPKQWNSPHISGTIKEKLNEAVPRLVQVDDLLDGLRLMLRGAETRTVLINPFTKESLSLSSPMTVLKWQTRLEVARALSWQLGIRKHLLALRTHYLQAMGAMRNVNTRFENEIKGPNGTIKSNRYDRAKFRGRDGEPHFQYQVKPCEFFSDVPHPDGYACVHHLNLYWNELVNQATQDFGEVWPLLKLPPYMDLKRYMCVGGRAAYSALMVCMTGSTSENREYEHSLFGWFGGYDSSEGQKLTTNIRKLCHNLRPARPEKKGTKGKRLAAPSWAAGVIELTHSVSTSDPMLPSVLLGDVRHRLAKLMRQVNDTNDNYEWTIDSSKPSQVRQALLCGLSSPELFSPHFLYTVKYPQLSQHHFAGRSKAATIARKVMSVDKLARLGNGVPTMLVGKVVHVHGSDYMARCIYTETVEVSRSVALSPIRRNIDNLRLATHEGYVLFRQNWQDMYHLQQSHALLPPVASVVTALLDTASAGHFARLRDAKELALSMNQRITGLLKQLRALPRLTKDDSYAVGNCTAGTKSFIDQLQQSSGVIIDDSIQGRTLAKCWRVGKYIQIDRFASVVKHLVKQAVDQAVAQEKARIMDGNPETAVHTVYAAEFAARYEGEDASVVLERMRQATPSVSLLAATWPPQIEQVEHDTLMPPGFRLHPETRTPDQIEMDNGLEQRLEEIEQEMSHA